MTTTHAPAAVATPNRTRTFISTTVRRQEFGIVVVLIVLSIIIDIINNRFLTPANISNLLATIAVIGIISVGQTYVLIAGEIDLSVGSVVGLAGVVAAALYSTGLDASIAVLGGLAAGALSGFVVGSAVVFGKVSSFIVTLGMLSIARGLTLLVTGGIPITMPTELSFIGQGSVFGIPVSVLIFVIVVIIGQFVLTRTVYGMRVVAIGDNPQASKVGGIPVGGTRIATFVIIGVLAGVAGIVFATQVGTADPQAGTGYELNVIAAAVIGGASLSGGRGSIVGAFFGACLLGLLQNAFVLLQLSSFLQEVSIGLVIVLAALFDQLRQGNLGSLRTTLRRMAVGRGR